MKVLIAAGGTGGHIYPGLAIGKEIQKRYPLAEIVFVGTQNGLEARLVPEAGFQLDFVRARGFRRKLSFDTLKTAGTLLLSLIDVARLLKRHKPDVVIGTGGYVCGAILFLAILKGIPTLMHESNALPGVTTRLLAPYLGAIAVNFEDTGKKLSERARVRVTGNPLREKILTADRNLARSKLHLSSQDKLVVVFFGSLGSSTMNRIMVDLLKSHADGLRFKLIYGTGLRHYDTVMTALDGQVPPGVTVSAYLYDADEILAAADLAVCRAGAMTPGELCVLGVPSVLVPSPYVADNHQEFNARSLETSGASVVVLEDHLNGAFLYDQITTLLDDENLRKKMSSAAKKLAKRHAGTAIIDVMDGLLAQKKQRRKS